MIIKLFKDLLKASPWIDVNIIDTLNSITPENAAAWKRTLNDLNNSQSQWLAFLTEMKTEDFSKVYPNNNMSYYEHIHGILQHDAYHLGQIRLLAKAF